MTGGFLYVGGDIMARFIPLNKQSKKAQKTYHRRSRGDWGEIKPVTRVIESGKAYSRAKERRQIRKARDAEE